MNKESSKINSAFLTFRDEAPNHARAWNNLVQELSRANVLDAKTSELIYIAVLAVRRLLSAIPFHVQAAKKLGATRDEVISAILVGLPVTGHVVSQVLPAVIEAYDEI